VGRESGIVKVLVTEADHYNTLAVVRSLGKRGWDITASGFGRFDQSKFSRYCSSAFTYPDSMMFMDEFVNCIVDVVSKVDYDVLLPVGLKTTIPLSMMKNKLVDYVDLPIPDYDTIIIAHDKSKMLKFAEKLGVPIPRTVYPSDNLSLLEAVDRVGLPCVVKLRKSTSSIGIKYLSTWNDVESFRQEDVIDSPIFNYSDPIVQEYVPGCVHDVCTLFNHGELVAVLTQKRLRTYPETGGGGIYNITTDEPKLREYSIRILKELKWHGPAQVEFKMDSQEGVPKLMEVNPKFWGTLDLSIKAGIDFPYLACNMGKDGGIESDSKYEIGLKYKWKIPFDVLKLILSRRKLIEFKDMISPEQNMVYDLSCSDLLPHIVVFLDLTFKLVNGMEHFRR